MDLRPSPEQTEVVDAFAGLYAKKCSMSTVMASEPTGFDASLWSSLREMGAVEMAIGDDDDERANLLDLALVAEQHGRYLAPSPMLEAQVAARLLAVCADHPAAEDAMASQLEGNGLTTIGVRPVRRGAATLVPAGAVSSSAIVLDEDRLTLVPLATARPVYNMGCLPLCDVEVEARGAVVLAEGDAALTAFATAVDEWRVLTAAALQGLAARALDIVVSYVKERHAFGRPIGSFQGISHRLADRATEVDGCELLVREAAWSAGEEPERLPELAAMALGFAAETACNTTYFAVHFHGGYGFMLEYAVQAYFRRARAWAAVLENPAGSYRLVAERRAARMTNQAVR